MTMYGTRSLCCGKFATLVLFLFCVSVSEAANNVITVLPFCLPTVSGSNLAGANWCAGVENGRAFCYGATNGCLWGQNRCFSNADCSPSLIFGAKYSDTNCNVAAVSAGSWVYHTCNGPTPSPTITPTLNPTKTPSASPTTLAQGLLDRFMASPTYRVKNGFAFAVVTSDGSVLTWGEATPGGSPSTVVQTALTPVGGVKVSSIVPSKHAFAAFKSDGSVVPWGVPSHYANRPAVPGVLHGLVASDAAFAALSPTGAVHAFGAYQNGGNVLDNTKCNGFAAQLASNVQTIIPTAAAFTALKTDGTVYTWGNAYCGGGVSSQTMTSLVGVTKVVATAGAFAARLSTGKVLTWGGKYAGGDSSAVASQLQSNVLHVVSAKAVFAAYKSDFSLVVWGYGPYGGEPSSSALVQLAQGVSFVSSTFTAMAAITLAGGVVTWGMADAGGDSSAVQSQLTNVASIVGNGYSFAALTTTGRVVTWGNPAYGGAIPADKVSALSSGVASIYSTNRAFAALKSDGSVVVWGQAGHGGSPGTAVEEKLTSGVHTICSNDAAFAAIKTDGTVVGWGHTIIVPTAGVLLTSSKLTSQVTCA